MLATQWVAITLVGLAVMVTISAALLLVAAAVAPLAAVMWAVAGYALCASIRVAVPHTRR